MGVRGRSTSRRSGRSARAAAAAGQTLRRDEWSLVIPMHLAETRREAFQSARHGAAAELLDYFRDGAGAPLPGGGAPERVIEQMADSGTWIVGTPDDCVAGIRRYQGGHGASGGPAVGPRVGGAGGGGFLAPGALRDAPLRGSLRGRGLRVLGGGARGGVPGPGPGGGGSAHLRVRPVRPVPRLSWRRACWRSRAGSSRTARKRQTEEEESLSFADEEGRKGGEKALVR